MSAVKKIIVNELYKPARKNFPRRTTVVKGVNDLYQIDLAEVQPFAKVNRGMRYILVVIDCCSKYLWTRPGQKKLPKQWQVYWPKETCLVFSSRTGVASSITQDFNRSCDSITLNTTVLLLS